MANDWYEKLRCPKCGKTGRATLSLDEVHMPIVEVVPDGFTSIAGHAMSRRTRSQPHRGRLGWVHNSFSVRLIRQNRNARR